MKTGQVKTKIGYTDYSVWDKFDVDAECEKLDSDNEDSDLTDEWDETARKDAYEEKEKGNKFVKDAKWDDAIKCYNKAVSLYSTEPIFYANRALCYLKKENYVKAELDCTMSLSLDSTYVKAYQRRAAARQALNKWEEVESDLKKALDFEPKNKEILNNLQIVQDKLKSLQSNEKEDSRPVSHFSSKRKKEAANILKCSFIKTHLSNNENSENEDIISVKAIKKPVQMQSKQPLKQIKIEEIESTNDSITMTGSEASPIGLVLNTNDMKVVERKFSQ